MGFWIFMMIINLLIPFTMLGFGKYSSKNAPKEINDIFGYRTSMSKKNKDTWEFAHHYCGKLWIKCGWITLVFSIIAMLVVIGKSINVVGITSGIVCTVQCIVLIGSIFIVERALKRKFDNNGKLR